MSFNRVLFSSASGDWETPPELFDALDKEFHFDLDACATPESSKCLFFIPPTANALEQNWPGRVFCNPPYGRMLRYWVWKGWSQVRLGEAQVVVMLLPARTDTQWFHQIVLPHASDIRFIRGRLKFSGHKNSAPFPSMVVVFRP